MKVVCDRGHVKIEFSGKVCPLCYAYEDRLRLKVKLAKYWARIEVLENEILVLEDKLIALRKLI